MCVWVGRGAMLEIDNNTYHNHEFLGSIPVSVFSKYSTKSSNVERDLFYFENSVYYWYFKVLKPISGFLYQFSMWLISLQGTSILDSLLLWEESKQQHNCLGIGYPLARAASGFGIQSIQGNLFLHLNLGVV